MIQAQQAFRTSPGELTAAEAELGGRAREAREARDVVWRRARDPLRLENREVTYNFLRLKRRFNSV